ncbi:MAG: hypothetical protein ACXWCG_10965, partial [Flavitalea sp.]
IERIYKFNLFMIPAFPTAINGLNAVNALRISHCAVNQKSNNSLRSVRNDSRVMSHKIEKACGGDQANQHYSLLLKVPNTYGFHFSGGLR